MPPSTPTNWCPVPPEPEQDGSVVAHSTGNKFGDICLGWDESGDNEPTPVATCSMGTIVELRFEVHCISVKRCAVYYNKSWPNYSDYYKGPLFMP